MAQKKRINLTHGSARVDEDISQETIEALNRLSEIAFEFYPCPNCQGCGCTTCDGAGQLRYIK